MLGLKILELFCSFLNEKMNQSPSFLAQSFSSAFHLYEKTGCSSEKSNGTVLSTGNFHGASVKKEMVE